MQKQTFKVGDKVYCPTLSSKLLTLIETGDEPFCLQLLSDENKTLWEEITEQGFLYTDKGNPFVFHATEENHKKLCDLYGVEFEAPPKQRESKEIIRLMFNDGWKSVPCYVANIKTTHSFAGVDCITAVRENQYQDINELWLFAVPFDPKTNKTIIDYVDGRIILE